MAESDTPEPTAKMAESDTPEPTAKMAESDTSEHTARMAESDTAPPFSIDIVSVRLVKDAPLYSNRPFNKPEEAITALRAILCEFDREVICVINLRSDLKPININFASIGALNEAIASPRELFKTSILSNAASIILMHCHPSGRLVPSMEDVMITDRMNRICKLMGIPLTDHIIVGGDRRGFFSFREKGLIEKESLVLETNYHKLDIGQKLKEESKTQAAIKPAARRGR